MFPVPNHPVLDGLLAVGLLASGAVLALSLVAFWRRRTRSFLLVAAAFATLCAQSVVAILMLDGVLSDPVHHLIEHAFVVAQSVLVLAAVYYARTVERATEGAE